MWRAYQELAKVLKGGNVYFLMKIHKRAKIHSGKDFFHLKVFSSLKIGAGEHVCIFFNLHALCLVGQFSQDRGGMLYTRRKCCCY